jgi:hypothetical protein
MAAFMAMIHMPLSLASSISRSMQLPLDFRTYLKPNSIKIEMEKFVGREKELEALKSVSVLQLQNPFTFVI